MTSPKSRCVAKMANGLPWTTGACGCLDNSRWRGDSPAYPSTSPTPYPSANITQRMVAHLWRFWNGENDSIWQPWFLNLNTCANFKKLVHFVKLCRDLPIFIIYLCYFCARKILFIAFWLYWPYQLHVFNMILAIRQREVNYY